MVFPILTVVTGWLSAWHLLIDILFVVAYLGVLTTESQSILGLLGHPADSYVVGNTAFVAVNYIVFLFPIQSLKLSFQRRWFKVSSNVCFSFCSQVQVVAPVDFSENRRGVSLLYTCNFCFFRFKMTFGLVDSNCGGFERRAQAKQNAQITIACSK